MAIKIDDILLDLEEKIKEFEINLQALKQTVSIYKAQKIATAGNEPAIKPEKEEITGRGTKIRPVKSKNKRKRSKHKSRSRAQLAIDILKSAGKPMKTGQIFEKMKEMNIQFPPNRTDKENQINLYNTLKYEKMIDIVDRGTWDLSSYHTNSR